MYPPPPVDPSRESEIILPEKQTPAGVISTGLSQDPVQIAAPLAQRHATVWCLWPEEHLASGYT